jgi:hypothetical protein
MADRKNLYKQCRDSMSETCRQKSRYRTVEATYVSMSGRAEYKECGGSAFEHGRLKRRCRTAEVAVYASEHM